MKQYWVFFVVFNVLVLSAETEKHSRALLAVRDTMEGSTSSPPTSLGSSARTFLNHFVRSGGLPNEIPKLDTNEDGHVDVNETAVLKQTYLEGMKFGFVFPFTLGCLTLMAWFLFCLCRGGCDWCGKRNATRKYTASEVAIVNYGMIALMITQVILFGLALTASVSVSRTTDDSVRAMDTFSTWTLTLINYVTNMQNLFAAQTSLANTIASELAALPTPESLTVLSTCIANVYATSTPTSRSLAVDHLATFNATTRSPSSDLTIINSMTNNYASAANMLPSLSDLISLSSFMLAVNDSREEDLSVFTTQFNQIATAISPLTYVPSLASGVSNLAIALAVSPSPASAFNIVNNRLDINVATAVSGLPDVGYLEQLLKTPPTTVTLMLTPLQQLNSSLYNFFPLASNLQPLANSLTALSQVVASLTAIPLSTVASRAVQLSTALTTLSSLVTPVQLVLAQLTAMQNGSSSASASLTAIRTAGGNYPNIPSYDAILQQVVVPHLNLKSNLSTVVADITLFNASYAGDSASCLSDLMARLQLINNTVVTLDSSVQPIVSQQSSLQRQFTNFSKISATLGVLLDELANVEVLFDHNHLPASFDDMRGDVAIIAQAFANFPDLTQVVSDVNNLVPAITALPPSISSVYFTPLDDIRTAVLALNAASFATFAATLQDLSDAVAILPDLSALSANVVSLITSCSSLDMSLSQAIAEVMSPSYIPTNGISSALATTLTADITSYNQSLLAVDSVRAGSVTPRTHAATDLNTLPLANNAVQIASLAVLLSVMGDGISTFPTNSAINSLTTPLPNLSTRLQAQTLVQYVVQDNQLALMTGAVGDMPYLQQLTATTTSIRSIFLPSSVTFSADMNNAAGALSSLSNFPPLITLADRDNTINTLNNLAALAVGMPALSNFTQLGSEWLDFLSFRSTLVAKRAAYQRNRVQYVTRATSWDNIRLAFIDVVLVASLVMSLLGVLTCYGKRGPPAMIVALTLFPIVATYFYLTALQMPVSMFASDACADPTHTMAVQLEGMSVDADHFGVLTVAQPIPLFDIYEYFAHCVGEVPEPMGHLLTIQESFPDATAQKNSAISQATMNGVTLQPSLLAMYDQLAAMPASFQSAASTIYFHLACNVTAPTIYQPIEDALCGSSGFAGAAALSTSLFLLLGFCTAPGIICGILGYKRFRPKNQGDEVAVLQDALNRQAVEQAKIDEKDRKQAAKRQKEDNKAKNKEYKALREDGGRKNRGGGDGGHDVVYHQPFNAGPTPKHYQHVGDNGQRQPQRGQAINEHQQDQPQQAQAAAAAARPRRPQIRVIRANQAYQPIAPVVRRSVSQAQGGNDGVVLYQGD